MSKASEWAHFAADDLKRGRKRKLRTPECWAAEKPLATLKCFASNRYGVRQFAADLTPAEAKAYARWILDTFGDGNTR